jgi:hypothetical protein
MVDDAKRQRRFERWESLGVEVVRYDLLTRKFLHVGGSPENRELAQEWVKMKDEEAKEVLTLKPTVYGVGIDLKLAAKRLRKKIEP